MKKILSDCEHPVLLGYFVGYHVNKNGFTVETIERSFKEAQKILGKVDLSQNERWAPCGHCWLCLRRKKQDRIVRIVHECETYDGNGVFITLTYDEDSVPRVCPLVPQMPRTGSEYKGYGKLTLCKKDVQDFLKRLRNYWKRKLNIKMQLRYDVVGEYGGLKGRPHYHMVIFGWFPEDARIINNKGKYYEYMSECLSKQWKHGRVVIGKVNNYVATYITKYIEKDEKWQADRCCLPEFELGSKSKGGLGYRWFKENYKQVVDQGFIYVFDRNRGQGYKMRIPKYYISCLQKIDPELYKVYKDKCKQYVMKNRAQFTEKEVYEALAQRVNKFKYNQYRNRKKQNERQLHKE